MDKFSELKAAAMAATPGPWGINRTGNTIVSNHSHPVATVSDAFHRQLAGGGVGKDAEFIAAANPAAVLALLADNEHLARELVARNGENEWLRKRAAELEAKDERIGELEAKLATPVRLPGKTSDLDSWDGGWDACLEECAEAVRAAGFTVEEDEQ
ncbi:TPA: ead/Ea22-like family protein [Serratia marcescens]